MAQLASERTNSLLEVLQWPSIGAARVREVACAALATKADPLAVAEKTFPQAAEKAHANRTKQREQLQKLMDACEKHDIHAVSLLDENYPARLRSVNDGPPIIFVRGDLEALNMPAVAVVGTREASEAGLKAASAIGSYLSSRNYAVVSGLALGIDAAAHKGALEGKGVTIAILAHGLHMIAPVTNRPIAEKLLEEGGALVSEHPPGVPPRPAEFAKRNRIQSGMSLASIVVESGAEGGAMIQANFTKLQGRPIFAVMSRDSKFNAAGAVRLLKDYGARRIDGQQTLSFCLASIANSLRHSGTWATEIEKLHEVSTPQKAMF